MTQASRKRKNRLALGTKVKARGSTGGVSWLVRFSCRLLWEKMCFRSDVGVKVWICGMLGSEGLFRIQRSDHMSQYPYAK